MYDFSTSALDEEKKTKRSRTPRSLLDSGLCDMVGPILDSDYDECPERSALNEVKFKG